MPPPPASTPPRTEPGQPPATGGLLRLFYASRAARPFAPDDLRDLVDTSARNNERLGITGVLCYKNGLFAQILEGDDRALLDLYLRITRDPRHHEPTLLSLALVSGRIFSGWRMGYLANAPLLGGTWEAVRGLRGRGEAQLQNTFWSWLELLEHDQGPRARRTEAAA